LERTVQGLPVVDCNRTKALGINIPQSLLLRVDEVIQQRRVVS
jgi:metal-responsive CopG/Arc/MetJ family transcriptional regulator